MRTINLCTTQTDTQTICYWNTQTSLFISTPQLSVTSRKACVYLLHCFKDSILECECAESLVLREGGDELSSCCCCLLEHREYTTQLLPAFCQGLTHLHSHTQILIKTHTDTSKGTQIWIWIHTHLRRVRECGRYPWRISPRHPPADFLTELTNVSTGSVQVLQQQRELCPFLPRLQERTQASQLGPHTVQGALDKLRGGGGRHKQLHSKNIHFDGATQVLLKGIQVMLEGSLIVVYRCWLRCPIGAVPENVTTDNLYYIRKASFRCYTGVAEGILSGVKMFCLV